MGFNSAFKGLIYRNPESTLSDSCMRSRDEFCFEAAYLVVDSQEGSRFWNVSSMEHQWQLRCTVLANDIWSSVLLNEVPLVTARAKCF
jgi:hypothetical protein